MRMSGGSIDVLAGVCWARAGVQLECRGGMTVDDCVYTKLRGGNVYGEA